VAISFWSSWFSNEKNGGSPDDSFLPITAVKCQDSNCAELALQTSARLMLSTDDQENEWQSFSFLGVCDRDDSFVTQIQCTSENCVDKKLRCSQLNYGYAVGEQMQVNEWQADGSIACESGFALKGLMCSEPGECSTFDLLCAEIIEVSTTTVPTPAGEGYDNSPVMGGWALARTPVWLATLVCGTLVVVVILVIVVITVRNAKRKKRAEKENAGGDSDLEDGSHSRLMKKSNAELQDIINKDEAAVERYKSLAKSGKASEYKSDLSVKELKELVEDLGFDQEE